MLQLVTAGLLLSPELDLKAPTLPGYRAIAERLYARGCEDCNSLDFLRAGTARWNREGRLITKIIESFRLAFDHAPSELQNWVDATTTTALLNAYGDRRHTVAFFSAAISEYERDVSQNIISICRSACDLAQKIGNPIDLPKSLLEEKSLSPRTVTQARDYLRDVRRIIHEAVTEAPPAHEPQVWRYQEFLTGQQRFVTQFQEWRTALRELTAQAVTQIDTLLEPARVSALTAQSQCIGEDTRILAALAAAQSDNDMRDVFHRIERHFADSPQVLKAMQGFPATMSSRDRLQDWLKKIVRRENKHFGETLLAGVENALCNLGHLDLRKFAPDVDSPWAIPVKKRLIGATSELDVIGVLKATRSMLLNTERQLAAEAMQASYVNYAKYTEMLQQKNLRAFEKIMQGWHGGRKIRSVEDRLDLLAFRMAELGETVEPTDPEIVKIRTAQIGRAQFQVWSEKWLVTNSPAVDILGKLVFSGVVEKTEAPRVLAAPPSPVAAQASVPEKNITLPTAPPPAPVRQKTHADIAKEQEEVARFIEPYKPPQELRLLLIHSHTLAELRQNRAVIIAAVGGHESVADELVQSNPRLLLGDKDAEFDQYVSLLSMDQVIGAIGAIKLSGGFRPENFSSLRTLKKTMHDAQAFSDLRRGIRHCCELLAAENLNPSIAFPLVWGGFFFEQDYVRIGQEEYWRLNMRRLFHRDFDRKEVTEQLRRLKQCRILKEETGGISINHHLKGNSGPAQIVHWILANKPNLPASTSIDELLPNLEPEMMLA